jgi:DNA-binding XRE family transcriptional regulator
MFFADRSHLNLITGAQIRAGRAFTRLTAKELAELAGVGRTTVLRAEDSDGVPAATTANLNAIKSALEAKGVIFWENGALTYDPGKPPKGEGK